jgi:hypothetical protein
MFVGPRLCSTATVAENTSNQNVEPDFKNRKFYGDQVLITGCICLAILVVVLVARTYSKVFIVKRITLDDCEQATRALRFEHTTDILSRCLLDWLGRSQ